MKIIKISIIRFYRNIKKKKLKILKEILKKVWIRWKLIKTHNNIGKILRNDQISNNMHIEDRKKLYMEDKIYNV